MSRLGRHRNFSGLEIIATAQDDGAGCKVALHLTQAQRDVPDLAREIAEIEDHGARITVHSTTFRAVPPGVRRHRDTRARQLAPGAWCNRVGMGSGTIGGLVIDEMTGEPALLSCASVIAGPLARPGDPVMQSGSDIGDAPEGGGIARLQRWHQGKDGDAAIAILRHPQAWTAPDLPTAARFRRFRPGETLLRQSPDGLPTPARVVGWGTYRIPCEVFPGLHHHVDVTGFRLALTGHGSPGLCAPGDGGAVWHDPRGEALVGLQFGDGRCLASGRTFALASDLDPIARRLCIRPAVAADLGRIAPAPIATGTRVRVPAQAGAQCGR